jgi:hypothetical protein
LGQRQQELTIHFRSGEGFDVRTVRGAQRPQPIADLRDGPHRVNRTFRMFGSRCVATSTGASTTTATTGSAVARTLMPAHLTDSHKKE